MHSDGREIHRRSPRQRTIRTCTAWEGSPIPTHAYPFPPSVQGLSCGVLSSPGRSQRTVRHHEVTAPAARVLPRFQVGTWVEESKAIVFVWGEVDCATAPRLASTLSD